MTFDVAAALLNKNDRRRKRYVLFLFGGDQNSQKDFATLEKSAETALKNYVHLHIEDPAEALNALLIKAIDLVVLDTSYVGTDLDAVEYAVEIKKRKKCPVLFVTRKEQSLIEAYKKDLILYQELDDYVVSPADFIVSSKRMRRITAAEGRAAKRFSVSNEANFYRLNTDKWATATLEDLSLVGFRVQLPHDEVLTRDEQVQIKIKLSDFGIFHHDYGDFLKLSGKIRRVDIEGKTIGCSFEHMTPMQTDVLTKILEKIARKKRAAAALAASAKATPEKDNKKEQNTY